jgi:hypothetical protein
MKKTPTPSKNDLLTILRQHERHESSRVAVLREAHAAAEKRLQVWKQASLRYNELKKAMDLARRRLYSVQERERLAAKQARTECLNAVRLYGPTPAVVKKVERFLARYS